MDILVESIYQLRGMTSRLLPEDTSVGDIIAAIAQNPSTGGIFLVDSNQRYTGMITREDLLQWTHIKLLGGKGRGEIPISKLWRLAGAIKAKDLARNDWKTLSVRKNDTVQTALDKMLNEREEIIPVIDESRMILGDLRLSEILWYLLKLEKQDGVE